MLPPVRLYLIRHGQTEWNHLRKAQGHTDIPLDAVGQSQAKALGRTFETYPSVRVLASDLARAYATAQAIDAEPTPVRDLREQSFGEWEGADYLGIRKRFIEAGDHHDVCAPGGESKRMVWDRLASVESRLRETVFDTAVVSHGGTLSMLTARLLGGTLDMAASFKFSNAGITEFERLTDGRFRLVRYDDTSHIDVLTTDAAHGVLG